MNVNGYEIERKFLIRRPEEALLRGHGGESIEMTQTYLLPGPEGENRRVRRCVRNGTVTRIYTEKKHITNIRRTENEREIGEEEYRELLRSADPACRPIEKVRWRIPFDGHVLEIDLFPFWQRQAYCEVELLSEQETLRLPDWLTVLREVTDDVRYTNHSLSKAVPAEDAALS